MGDWNKQLPGKISAALGARTEGVLRGASAICALLLIAAIGAMSHQAFEQFSERIADVEHTQRVQLEIAALQSSLARAHWQWRNFMISGSRTARNAHEEEAGALLRRVDSLARMTADNPDQQERLSRVRALLYQDLGNQRDAITRREAGALRRAEDILREIRRVGESTARLAPITASLHQEERNLLEWRSANAATIELRTGGLIVAGSAASIALLLAAFWFVRRELARRHAAERIARDLFDNAPCGYHSVDIEGRIVRMNRTWLSWLGYEHDEVVGKKFHHELMTPESARQFHEQWFPQFLAQGELHDVEFEYLRKDGSRLPGSLQATAILDASGRYLTSRSVVIDITARKQMETRLESAIKELDAFSYSVSHDLRAPLRAINGYALMLEEDHAARLDDEGRRLLGVVRDEARRMGRLIDDLLEFSRTGRQTLQSAPVDMAALAREVADELSRAHPPARISIGALPPARGDRAMLRQLWTNLIDNALKYSSRRSEPTVEIGGRLSERLAEYWVRDNGAGFDPRYASKLFGVFQRLHDQDEFPGTGVGLAIVQRVAVRHGGSVSAESAVGQGACFRFIIPAGGAET